MEMSKICYAFSLAFFSPLSIIGRKKKHPKGILQCKKLIENLVKYLSDQANCNTNPHGAIYHN